MIVFQIMILVLGATVPIYSWLGMFAHTDRLLGWKSGMFSRLVYIVFCVMGLPVVCMGMLELIEVPNVFFFTLCYLSLVVLGSYDFKKTFKAS